MTIPTDFLIIAPLQEELAAVRRRFPEGRRLAPDKNDVRVYFQGAIPVTLPGGEAGVYRVTFVSPLGMGQLDAATVTSDAIRRWEPRYVVLVGIAGGVDGRVALGDVLIANQCVDYELQKLRPDALEPRYNAHPADARLLNAAYYVEGWQERTTVARPREGKSQSHVGPVLSGNKVLADGTTMNYHLRAWPKLIGVEMEAGGVSAAAFQAVSKPGVLMVRGVSDLANAHKDSPTVASWRDYACDVAAAFLRAFLESGPVAFSEPTVTKAPEKPEVGPRPAVTPKGPSSKQVSALLYDVLRVSSSFDAFCLDSFPEVYRMFGGGMDREARHTLLLTRHEPEEVVAAVKEYDREQFDRYAAKHLVPVTPVVAATPQTTRPAAPPTKSKGRVRVACFFAAEDAVQADELRRFLLPMVSSGKLEYWSVRDIQPGDVRGAQIDRRLAEADVLLFCVSADLFADEDASAWLERALRRQQDQGTPVIPILLRPVVLSGTALQGLMPLPTSGRAISLWRNRDEAWVDVVQGLQRLL